MVSERDIRDLRDALYLCDNDQAELAEGFLNRLIAERDEAEAKLASVVKKALEEADKDGRIINDWKHTARRHVGLYKGEKELHARTKAKLEQAEADLAREVANRNFFRDKEQEALESASSLLARAEQAEVQRDEYAEALYRSDPWVNGLCIQCGGAQHSPDCIVYRQIRDRRSRLLAATKEPEDA